MPIYLSEFEVIRPRFELDQEKTLAWIAEAHGQAEAHQVGDAHGEFMEEVRQKLFKIGFGKDKIAKRGIQIEDFVRDDWSSMDVYPLSSSPKGAGFTKRCEVFDREVGPIFASFYPEGAAFPDHLIHVTCTGYVSPSPAQQIVSKRNQGQRTTVTHAYHMGCYGAFAAVRMGFGYLHLPSSQVDVVHTEMCSLHLHPLKHSIDQLIVQSLFADGFIKYSLKAERGEGAAFAIRALQEETIPNTLSSMSWSCEDHGLGMTLSKEVPAQISAALPGFIERLWKKAGVQERGMTLYTVHPGGPKILAQIERLLRLNAEQIRYSHQVLSHYGNMSSATLPHMWDLILADREIPEGTQVISLAFGPGLSISGALFEKTGE